MIRPRAQLAALVACAALIVGAGCGSDDDPEGRPLPRQAANELEKRLDEVQRRFDAASEEGKAGACNDIDDDSYPAIDRIVNTLPENVDPEVRDALQASLERLRELTREGCADVEDTTTQEEPAPPVTTPPPAPVEPQPAPEPTETQPPPQDENKDEEKKKKPDEGQEEDGGIGPNGQGPPGQDGGGQPAPPASDG